MGTSGDLASWMKRVWGVKLLSPTEWQKRYPQGDPGSVHCRWCGAGRVRIPNKRNGRLRSELECLNCDEQGAR